MKQKGKVTFGDNQSSKIIGKGTVVIRDKMKAKIILRVEKLKANLLSVIQTYDQEHAIKGSISITQEDVGDVKCWNDASKDTPIQQENFRKINSSHQNSAHPSKKKIFKIYANEFYGYFHCCHKFGHKADDCRIKEEDEGLIRKEDTNILMEKYLFVSYVTVLDTLQNIARIVHASLPRKLKKKYGR